MNCFWDEKVIPIVMVFSFYFGFLCFIMKEKPIVGQSMSKLYFKFGAMASSKTANALMTKFNYEEKGNRVWLIKPDLDDRDDYVD